MILFALLDDHPEELRASGGPQDASCSSSSSQDLVRRIRLGDADAFESLFTRHHHALIQFSLSMVRSREFARDIVQDVFLKIWKNREQLFIHTDIRVYLFQSVRNQTLNLIERNRSRLRFEDQMEPPEPFQPVEAVSVRPSVDRDEAEEPQTEEQLARTRLIRRVWEEVARMPERRRLVFELHKRHGLSYQEISEVCDISLKTVENHIGQALLHLRDALRDELS